MSEILNNPPDVSDTAKFLALVSMLQEVVQHFIYKPSEEAIHNMLCVTGFTRYQDWETQLDRRANEQWQRMNQEWLNLIAEGNLS